MSSDRIWQRYGEQDPYYGVLTLERYRRGSIAENRDAFFASGEAQVAAVLARVEAAVGPVRRGHALDFGAGVGRLSLPLADRFARTTCVDVSPGMLAELARNAAGRGNVATADSLAAVPPTLDFALSLIVLQHVPVARGLAAIAGIYERLAPGGVLALEVPVACGRTRAWRLVRRIRDRMPYVQTAWNALRGRPLHDGGMQMNLYALDRIAGDLFGQGAASVTLLPSAPDPDFAGVLVVARKP
jgi:SAM-dependent methyltransferase